jgi:hypothetical protein
MFDFLANFFNTMIKSMISSNFRLFVSMTFRMLFLFLLVALNLKKSKFVDLFNFDFVGMENLSVHCTELLREGRGNI